MAKEKNETGTDSVFEVKKIRELIELMQEHELNEVDLKQADQRIRLRRGPEGQPVTYAQPQPPRPSQLLHLHQQPLPPRLPMTTPSQSIARLSVRFMPVPNPMLRTT